MAMRSVLFFLPDARRVIRFPQPMTQLKLPAYLLIATLACGAVFAWQSQSAYERMYDLVISEVPASYVVMIQEQTHDFAAGLADKQYPRRQIERIRGLCRPQVDVSEASLGCLEQRP